MKTRQDLTAPLSHGQPPEGRVLRPDGDGLRRRMTSKE